MGGRSKQSQRSRTFSHKVTTGCITCKKRRKKCGEERPTCLRCRKGGFVCDGYASTTDKDEHSTGHSSSMSDIPAFGDSECHVDSLRRLMLPGDYMESYHYAHFFAQTILDLEITPCINAAFWRESFSAPSQTTRCVWHATVALGAMHWLYTMPNFITLRLESFVIGHYNQAVSELLGGGNQSLAKHPPTNLSNILICCFMFVILECLRGNYSEAMRHLESGSKLLISKPIEDSSSNQSLRNLAAMFHAISSQVSLFSDDRLLPDLTGCMVPLKKRYRNQSSKFRDLDEAEDVMNSFDDTLMYIRDLDQDWDDKKSNCNKQWDVLREQVEAWGPRFVSLLEDSQLDTETLGNQKRVVNLKIQIRLWELHVQGETPIDVDWQLNQGNDKTDIPLLSPSECFELLEQIEQLWWNSPRPEFGLKCDIITAIYQLYGYCTDLSARRRIISMLRSRKIRAIVWDSHQLAEYLEGDVTFQEQGIEMSVWPDIGPSTDDGALITFKPHWLCS